MYHSVISELLIDFIFLRHSSRFSERKSVTAESNISIWLAIQLGIGNGEFLSQFEGIVPNSLQIFLPLHIEFLK